MIPSTYGHFLKSGKVSILKRFPNAVAYFFPSNFLDSGSTVQCLQCGYLPACSKSSHTRGFFLLLYSIHKTRRTEREHEDIIVAYLGHPHYTLWQQGRCKHVIHPCEEIQPFHRPEASLRELERYSYFLPFRATLIDNKIAVARQLVMKC